MECEAFLSCNNTDSTAALPVQPPMSQHNDLELERKICQSRADYKKLHNKHPRQ